ncbi:MAG: ExbD/TolR family protein [Pirellulaceae bacterium]
MTPMIDVVFLLIIFFLVSSHLAKQEAQLELQLPVAESGEQDPLVQTPRVTINVREDGSLTMAGRPVLEQSLGERLVAAKVELGDDVQVRIRCSRAASYGAVEPVMLACTKNGIFKVTYAVYREDR